MSPEKEERQRSMEQILKLVQDDGLLLQDDGLVEGNGGVQDDGR